MSRRFLAFAAAASLCAAPAAAAPSPAPAPAAETVEGSALHGVDPAYWILPLLIVIALLIAILASEEPNSKPASP